MQPALGLLEARPPALPAGAGRRARRAADGRVALVVQRVVGEATLGDAGPDVVVRPLDERVVLPQPAGLVALDRLRGGPRGGLDAADARDPALGAVERPLQRRDLGVAAAVLGGPGALWAPRLLRRDVDAEALLESAPRGQGLGEQDAGVDGHDPNVAAALQARQRVDE